MIFAQKYFLYLFLLIPILVVLYVLLFIRRKKNIAVFGNPALIQKLMPAISKAAPWLKAIILLFAVTLFILLLARPQYGSKEEKIKRQGIEVIVALDISNSMLVEDVSPNRLERSKQILSKLIDDLSNDKFGLIVFAGSAYTQVPITTDYVSAKMFLSNISPTLIARQGTAIGSAIDMAISSFGTDEGKSRAIIVITDGENHEDDAVAAAKEAAAKGIVVNVVGIGKPSGEPIPVPGTMNYRKDRQGNVVVSKLNEQMCSEIALAGGGVYVRADNTNNALAILQKNLDKLAKSDIETKVYSAYNEQFQLFGWVILFLLVLEIFLSERRYKWLDKVKLFKE